MNIMRKTLLLLTFLMVGNIALFAQIPTAIQCTLSLEEIAQAQPYHRDHPKQEETELIATTLITEFNTLYELMNLGNSTDLINHIEIIESTVNAAITLGMNYSMFQADLDFMETLN